MHLLLLVNAIHCCTERFKLSLQKFLFQNAELNLSDCAGEVTAASAIAALVKGVDAQSVVPMVSMADLFESGWPLGALLVALGYDRANQGGVLAPVDAVTVLVHVQMGVCEKVYGVLSLAATQLPVLSEDISGFVRVGEDLMRAANLSLIDCPVALRALAKLEAANFFARVDANEFYESQDDRLQQYALHQIPNRAITPHECLGGQKPPCSFYAGLGLNVDYWNERGVDLDDVDLAFRPVTDLKLVRVTKVGGSLEISVPLAGHYFGRYTDELRCISEFIQSVHRKFGLPDFELILNHGDLPLSRRVADKPPFYDFSDGTIRTPVPVFSLVGSPHFHDMLFPNVCRPKVGNLTLAAPELADWDSKLSKAFYRGTDRGAVNWRRLETPIKDLKSQRRQYFDSMRGKEALVDFALLEDDLFNATVVFSDPHFVPFEQSQRWKYVLDIPGNGYSGSLKQKLTSSSAVFVVSKPQNFPQHLPVTEHFYFGLEAYKHYVPIESPEDLVKKVEWAREHDDTVRLIRENANQYMESFLENSECYAWLLLSAYAEALKFRPQLSRTLRSVRHYQVTLDEPYQRGDNNCLQAAGFSFVH